jgi:hypothetical protein
MNDNSSPEHPGEPKWQTYSEWVKTKTPQSIDYKRSAEESREEQFERFKLVDEGGAGWGDASDAQDAGWGAPTSSGW